MSVKVLLASFDRFARTRWARALTLSGYDVECVDDGLAALESLDRATPAVVVTDWMMPLLDGFDLRARIRASPSAASLPVILLVARAADGVPPRNDGTAADLMLCKDDLDNPFEIVRYLRKLLGSAAAPEPANIPKFGLKHVATRSPEQRRGAVRANVLLVDDESGWRERFGSALAAAGYEVTEAAGGIEALAALRASRPDILVLDLMMPFLDGFEVFRILKSDAATTQIPVIVLQAQPALVDFNGYVGDPFEAIVLKHRTSPVELVRAVTEILAKPDALPPGKIWNPE